MNDYLKFRVWDTEMGHFIEPPLQTNGEVLSPMNQDIYVVQRSTGLTDKNGKLIYEGDILRGVELDDYVLVLSMKCWDSGFSFGKRIACMLDGKPVPLPEFSWTCFSSWVSSSEMYEVVGNGFENPEWLNHENQ